MTIKIVIGADIVPTKSNVGLFAKADIKTLIGENLKKLLELSNFTIFNLEVPLTDKSTPIKKCGPNLIAPTKTIAGLKTINPHFFTLANNHILDQGEQGLNSTMSLLDKYGIAYAGAGKDLEEAAKPYIFEQDGKKIGIYCCAEHEFTIATETTSGANPFDPLNSLDHVMELKKQCDYVIVLYHGGKEHYRYPSPYLQKVCRKIVDKGADIVVCQHSHCIGCEEKWHGGTIVYGQGNFLFDADDNEYWNTSLLIELEIDKDIKVNYVPLCKDKNKVILAEPEVKNKIIQDFNIRSSQIADVSIIESKYNNFAETMFTTYISSLAGRISVNILFRIINKLSGHRFAKYFLNCCYSSEALLAIQNFIECEAHRELLVKGIKMSCKKNANGGT